MLFFKPNFGVEIIILNSLLTEYQGYSCDRAEGRVKLESGLFVASSRNPSQTSLAKKKGKGQVFVSFQK